MVEDVKKMKVAELRKELQDAGLPTTGNKAELVSRLEEHLAKGASAGAAEPTAAAAAAGTAPAAAAAAPAAPAAPAAAAAEATAPGAAAATAAATAAAPAAAAASAPAAAAAPGAAAPSVEDRLKARAERFGVVSDDIRLKARAQRFGGDKAGKSSATMPAGAKAAKAEAKAANRIDVPDKASLLEIEKLKARAAKFGTSSPILKKLEADEKRKEELAKKQERAARFKAQSAEEETKKQARSARFQTA